MADTLRWGSRGIRQRKLRSALTILGIVIGVAAVIALVSQTEGISGSINSQFNKLGPNTISIRPASTSVVLTQADVNRISQMPGVELVVPVVQSVVKVYGAQQAKTFTLIGIDPVYFDALLTGYELSNGELFKSFSYTEIVVGSNVYQPQDMTSPFVNVGQSVTVEFGTLSTSRKVLSVVGSLNPYGITALVSVDDSIFMSIKGVSAMLGSTSYNALFVKTVDTDTVDTVVNNLKANYGTNLNIITVKQITQVVTTITGQLTILLGAIAAISLFVAGLGITNIMFVSVIERTKEIGVLKAVGFKSRDVLSIFLSEAVVVGIIGGILGLLLGTGISYLIPIVISRGFSSQSAGDGSSFGFGSSASSFTYNPVIRPEIAILVFLFALAVSLIAGFYPARRASKMDPVVALRHE
jgi:ABC-type antimicrobial peptide transport system permease subunit